MDRRTFLKSSIILGGASLTAAWPQLASATSPARPIPPPTFKAQVAFVKTDDRATGVKKALALLNLNRIKGKNLFLKPNFNSADPAPGSTHPDTLSMDNTESCFFTNQKVAYHKEGGSDVQVPWPEVESIEDSSEFLTFVILVEGKDHRFLRCEITEGENEDEFYKALLATWEEKQQ